MWVLVRTASPRRGGSIEYPQSIFWKKYEKYQILFIWLFHFTVVKFSICLNRLYWVMCRVRRSTEHTRIILPQCAGWYWLSLFALDRNTTHRTHTHTHTHTHTQTCPLLLEILLLLIRHRSFASCKQQKLRTCNRSELFYLSVPHPSFLQPCIVNVASLDTSLSWV